MNALAEQRKKVFEIVESLPDDSISELLGFLNYLCYKFIPGAIAEGETEGRERLYLDLPNNFLENSRISETDLKLELAIFLFQQEKITLGRASQLAGLNQLEFQRHLGRRKISIHYGVDDFRQDLKVLESENQK